MAPAHAQADKITGYEIERNDAFQKATRFSRLQRSLIYIDQLDGEIPMDGAPRYTPPEEEDGELSDTTINANRLLLLVLVIAAITCLIMFGGPLLDRFAGKTNRRVPRNGQKLEVPAVEEGSRGNLLSRLRGMQDLEAGLVELVQEVLEVAALQNDLRLGRSETARELLRRMPKSWRYLADLKRIVMTEELVQFGGRPIDRATYDDCLDRAAPIFGNVAT